MHIGMYLENLMKTAESSKFIDITPELVDDENLYRFVSKFQEFVLRCAMYMGRFGSINIKRRTGLKYVVSLDTGVDIIKLMIQCRLYVRAKKYSYFNNPKDEYYFPFIEMEETPFIDFDSCYRGFKTYLKKVINDEKISL